MTGPRRLPDAPDDFRATLLAKFPTLDPSWTDDLKKAWFADFDLFMKMVTPPRPVAAVPVKRKRGPRGPRPPTVPSRGLPSRAGALTRSRRRVVHEVAPGTAKPLRPTPQGAGRTRIYHIARRRGIRGRSSGP